MKFCLSHWDKLRAVIKARGLFDLVAASGQEAMGQMIGELQGEKKTLNNFDPLMAAHNMIFGNAMETLRYIGQNPLMLMMSDPEHPERECPICLLNWLSEEHDRTCTVPDCKKVKGQRFDDWIDKAADGAAEAAKALPRS